MPQHAGALGLIERVAISEHFDGLDRISSDLDVERSSCAMRGPTRLSTSTAA
jgi:hypothetical protein